MRSIQVAFNPATRRCHGARPGSLARQGGYGPLTRVERVPNRVADAAVCILLERKPAARRQASICYQDLARSRRKR